MASNTSPTQSGERVPKETRSAPSGAGAEAREVHGLLHHLTVELLRDNFLALKRDAAPFKDMGS